MHEEDWRPAGDLTLQLSGPRQSPGKSGTAIVFCLCKPV
jgi:hypothetical protein